MKKFFAFAITALAMVAVFSSCKKDEITDEQYVQKIVANATYKGKYVVGELQKDEAIVAFSKSPATGVQEFALTLVSDEPDPSDPTSIMMVGKWSVSNGNLTLSATAVYGDSKKTATCSGAIKDGGDKFTLEQANSNISFVDMKVTKANK